MGTSAPVFDITVVGHVTRDTIVRGGTSSSRLGGVPYYAGIAARALGAKVRIITRVAREDDHLLNEVRRAGITVHNYTSRVTTRFVNRYSADHGLRTQQVDAAADTIEPEHLTGRSRLWYFGPVLPGDIAVECFDHEQTHSDIVVLDVQGLARVVSATDVLAQWAEHATTMVESANIVKFGEDELRAAIGERVDMSKPILPWADGREIVVTSGARGATVYVSGVRHRVAAFRPRSLVDTTGCGDTFLAAYVCKRLSGHDASASARFASAAAALKAENAGPLRASAETVDGFARLAETKEISSG